MTDWWEAIKKPYRDVFDIFGRYWRSYGGWRALVTSPYLHVAVLLSGMFFHHWLRNRWWETALSVVPSIIGFTLAGFTIWLGFGNEKFQHLLSKKKDGVEFSPYIVVSATFVHFILIGALSVLAAVVGLATDFALPEGDVLTAVMPYLAPVGHFIGFTLFVYALMTAVAATMGVFRLAFMFDRIRERKPTEAATLECHTARLIIESHDTKADT